MGHFPGVSPLAVIFFTPSAFYEEGHFLECCSIKHLF